MVVEMVLERVQVLGKASEEDLKMVKVTMSAVALVRDPAQAMVQVNTMPKRPRSDAA